MQDNVLPDGGTEWDNTGLFLTEAEAEVLAHLSDEQVDAYLLAFASYEAMQAYLADPAQPPEAKALLDVSGWK